MHNNNNDHDHHDDYNGGVKKICMRYSLGFIIYFFFFISSRFIIAIARGLGVLVHISRQRARERDSFWFGQYICPGRTLSTHDWYDQFLTDSECAFHIETQIAAPSRHWQSTKLIHVKTIEYRIQWNGPTFLKMKTTMKCYSLWKFVWNFHKHYMGWDFFVSSNYLHWHSMWSVWIFRTKWYFVCENLNISFGALYQITAGRIGPFKIHFNWYLVL